MQRNYEVIRFVQQNGKCHIVMDYVEGELLCNFLKRNSLQNKEAVLRIIISIARELDNLERSDGCIYYPYLTPLHIVIKTDSSIAFIKACEKYNLQMERKIEPFVPEDGTDNYIYSYGRTVQYILNNVECSPHLSGKEERKLKKIISKCLKINSKKQYQCSQDIVNQLISMKKKRKHYIFLSLLLVVGVFAILGQKRIASEEAQEISIVQEKSSKQILQEYLSGETDYSDNEIEEAVKAYEQDIDKTINMADREFLLRIYYKLDTDWAGERAVEVGAKMFCELAKNREILADIYIRREEVEKAIEEYEILLKECPSTERYLTLANLLEQCGRQGEALKVCEEGSAYDSKGAELQMKYVKLLWVDSEYSIEEKKRELEKFLSLYPTLYENERFVQMKSEIGIEEDKNEN